MVLQHPSAETTRRALVYSKGKKAALIVACGLIAGSAQAQTPDDTQLQWGPCPAFLPQGCQIAVLHGDPGKPNADIFFKVPGKTRIPSHWHSSAERMVLVAGELSVEYEGEKTKIMTPGMYAYGAPKHHHSAECVSAVPCVLFIAFEAPIDAMATESKTK
jgi:mannose-6-phosphate isomerase-like protein (cupin superfamily)